MTAEVNRMIALLIAPAVECGVVDLPQAARQLALATTDDEARLLVVKRGIEELRRSSMAWYRQSSNLALLSAADDLLQWQQELELDLVTGWTAECRKHSLSVTAYVEVQERSLNRFRSAYVASIADIVLPLVAPRKGGGK